MRILYNSRDSQFKTPFGTVNPGQVCRLCVHVPSSVGAQQVVCILQNDSGREAAQAVLSYEKTLGAYDHFSGNLVMDVPGLYFYYFRIYKKNGSFRLFKYGAEDTNMEAGSLWQISCVPDYDVPQWAIGGTMYQIFPDRFCKSGSVDLKGKLEPYTVHASWDEEVGWQPNEKGEILNNDFYGGNFRGITEKMDYIASLGVTVLYLNPISKSFSSHRYDTGDYKQPDPMLGTMEDFKEMCRAAHEKGIKVVLDGVYSHTGSNSLYFNREKAFGPGGAYWDKESPYSSWYQFYTWPDIYNSWWGFDTLPTVNKMDPGFVEYIITGEDSVVAHWLKAGCDGFRLDVADELPNEFLILLKKRIREINPDALLMGEVWEDASNKIAYGQRRRYFVDGELDSVMNYPFRTAIINYLRGLDDGKAFRETVLTIAEDYPHQVLLSNMNLLGTHDSPRILSSLLGKGEGSREELAKETMSAAEYAVAKERLMVASFLQFMLPGMPSIYYGDEAGMAGGKDPFNRRTYPWGKEDRELYAHHCRLGQLRKEQETLRLGDIAFFQAGQGRIGFSRSFGGKKLSIYVNLSEENWEVPAGNMLLGHNLRAVAPNWISLQNKGYCLVEEA
ncbi:MAG: glycoside hydrolase family 13 protein [Oscillospiraceae bacterium]|nr:glycoside hydrolase family 13 protein [Oscillospiraceae bacterium]